MSDFGAIYLIGFFACIGVAVYGWGDLGRADGHGELYFMAGSSLAIAPIINILFGAGALLAILFSEANRKDERNKESR